MPRVNRRATRCEFWQHNSIPFCLLLALLMVQAPASSAESTSLNTSGDVVLEVYVSEQDDLSKSTADALSQFASKRKGIVVRTFNAKTSPQHAQRLEQLRAHFKLQTVPLPYVYACNSVIYGWKDDEDLLRRVAAALTVTLYKREGCPHCADARRFLLRLIPRYPAFQLNAIDVTQDADALKHVQQLVQRYRKTASSLPIIHLCNTLVVGYDTDASTGRRIESILSYYTIRNGDQKSSTPSSSRSGTPNRMGLAAGIPIDEDGRAEGPDLPVPAETTDNGGHAGDLLDENDLPPPPFGGDFPPQSSPDEAPPFQEPAAPEEIDVPFMGRLSSRGLGMPAFTFLVGLVDGFNPCAMWVLMFLLSLLVNLHSRAKILAVAGTFVVISGVAYFAFMAAWLNLFMLIGFLRPAQIALGLLAVTIGAVHVKDFFAMGKGISLSIPASAKPGIYDRIRRIVMAEHLAGAIAGAIVLAVLVNMIELLCTAGLPAMYTEILAMQHYPPWKYYAMLGLYNLAYMLDDTIMVGLVVITLGKRKLQEREGSWLKLISGLVVLLLGLTLLLRPEWLK